MQLTAPASGMPAGSQGVLIGWYATEDRQALVNFWDGGPLRVPAELIEHVPRPSDSATRP